MNLIDANELQHESCKICSMFDWNEECVLQDEKDCHLKQLIKRLKHYDMESVAKHGHWIQNEFEFGQHLYNSYKCSCCREEFMLADDEITDDNLYNFCPNCGAKMDEEVSK